MLLTAVGSAALAVLGRSAVAQAAPVAGEVPTGGQYSTTPVVTGQGDIGVSNPGLLDHSMASVRNAFELQLAGGAGLPLGNGIGGFLEAHPRIAELADAGGPSY